MLDVTANRTLANSAQFRLLILLVVRTFWQYLNFLPFTKLLGGANAPFPYLEPGFPNYPLRSTGGLLGSAALLGSLCPHHQLRPGWDTDLGRGIPLQPVSVYTHRATLRPGLIKVRRVHKGQIKYVLIMRACIPVYSHK